MIKPLLKILIKIFSKIYENRSIKDQIKNNLYDLEYYTPGFITELQGLSESTNINIKEILLSYNILKLSKNTSCTTSVVTKDATKKHNTYLIQNWDIPFYGKIHLLYLLFLYQRFKVCKIKNNNSYVFYGFPVLFELPIINEKGVCFGGNATLVTSDKKRYVDKGPGIPIYLLVRKTMRESDRISDVKNIWMNNLRSSNKSKYFPYFWDLASSSWADRYKNILIIEQSHNHIITVDNNNSEQFNGFKDVIWHTNHHKWLDPDVSGSEYPSIHTTSRIRNNRSYEYFKKHYGRIDLDTCKSFTRDHKYRFFNTYKNSNNICRHVDPCNRHGTLFSYIVEPEKYLINFCPGIPCKTKYKKIDCKKLLKIK